MSKIVYELMPRDLLFFRDARPMDADKRKRKDYVNVGHGAEWPRPDLLFSAAIHHLIQNPDSSERDWYGSVQDLHVTGPFPFKAGEIYLPLPLDWDMKLYRFSPDSGVTDIPEPLKCGFVDRTVKKKSYPRWIRFADLRRYLEGEVGLGKSSEDGDAPDNTDMSLMRVESRVGTTLDAGTGASQRVAGTRQGQYRADYLRLGKGVSMLCEVETARNEELDGADVRFGGQGGRVRFTRSRHALTEALERLPKGKPSCYVRWTLLSPALFTRGWMPNWIGEVGKVMLPMEQALRHPGESRDAYRRRAHQANEPFKTARLVAARIGDPVVFSGYDCQDGEKPTKLAVPAGSVYVFVCDTVDEAQKLVDVLGRKRPSDLGEKGFGYGLCSFVPAPTPFTATKI